MIRPRAMAAMVALAPALVAGCRSRNVFRKLDFSWNRMQVQPRYDPYAPSPFFADGMAMRPAVPGTVAYSTVPVDGAVEDGVLDGAYVAAFPLVVTESLVERGREQFEIVCAACHGVEGDGDSVVAGFMGRRPPSLEERRIRELPDGRIYEVIRDGYGFMPQYGTHFDLRDRWAVVAYVRALQRSRHAIVARLPRDIQGELARNAP